MHYTEIQRQDWKAFFDVVDHVLTGQRVELEIASLDRGDQIEIEWTGLDGLSYNPEQDSIRVQTTDESHEIERPTEIFAVEDNMVLRMLTVRDCIGQIQIIRFREPMLLPAPESLVS